jgi:hypothetical protein
MFLYFVVNFFIALCTYYQINHVVLAFNITKWSHSKSKPMPSTVLWIWGVSFAMVGGSTETEPDKLSSVSQHHVSQHHVSQESAEESSEVDHVEQIGLLAAENVAGGSGQQQVSICVKIGHIYA